MRGSLKPGRGRADVRLVWTGSMLAMTAAYAVLSAFGVLTIRSAIAATRTAERRLAVAERRFELLVENSAEAVTVLDAGGRFTFAGPACSEVLAIGADELVGLRLEDLVDAEDVADCRDRISTLLARRESDSRPGGPPESMRWEARGGRTDGPVWLEFSARRLPADADADLLLNIRDVTEHRVAVEELDNAAAHDHLTGLKTRREFLRQASRATAVASAEQPVALLFCDLDGFSGVNDVYGRAAGDEVLRAVAARLRRVLRPQELVGRIGGDEFAVLLPGPVDDRALGMIVERLQSAVAPAITLHGGGSVRIGMSVGQALINSPTPDAESVLPYADRAMYATQVTGRLSASRESVVHDSAQG